MASPSAGWTRVFWSAALAAATVFLAGAVLTWSARVELEAEAERELQLLMSLRLSTLSTGLDELRSEMELWSDVGQLKESLRLYAGAFQALGPGGGDLLRRRYVTESPYPEGERHFMVDAGDGSEYSRLHAARQQNVLDFLTIHRYHDVFMIEAGGTVVYSYFKAPDFGTNLIDGPYFQSGLGRVFREAKSAADRNGVFVVDFSPYEPAGGAPALFVASPVHDESGFIGVLAAQLSADAVSGILRVTDGMGETGETYAVGEDRLMRSDSRFTDESDVLVKEVDTESVRAAFEGQSDVRRAQDYRDVEVLSAFGLLDVEGLRWAILAEQDMAEVLAPVRRLRGLLLKTGLVIVVLVTLLAIPSRDRADWLRSPELARERGADPVRSQSESSSSDA